MFRASCAGISVEDVDKLVRSAPAAEENWRRPVWWDLLQSEVNAPVTAVLLGMARLDAFDANAEAQPPHGEVVEVETACAEAKGTPLSLRMLAGQAALLKKPLKHCESVNFLGRESASQVRRKRLPWSVTVRG